MSVTMIALSDSHTATLQRLPSELRTALATADIIIHAGDHTEAFLLEELRAIGQVVAVAGNMDSLSLKMSLPIRQLFTVNGKSVGVTHGSGAPFGIARRVRALFPEDPDVIVFGHSHIACNELVDGVLMVNPGSAAHGYARITVGEAVSAQLVST